MADILVVDDEPEVCDSIALTLGLAGHTVRTAADGPAGIAACREQAPQLVLTDLVMPLAHGFEVIGRVRSEFPGVRILAISGGGEFGTSAYRPEAVTTNAYLAAALEMGADAILRKPFNRQELLAAIETCLASTRNSTEH
ncbi:MAG: response regulator [Proteobacteria bacterium]|nr:response regulator [Pseudomonadota bacterium]